MKLDCQLKIQHLGVLEDQVTAHRQPYIGLYGESRDKLCHVLQDFQPTKTTDHVKISLEQWARASEFLLQQGYTFQEPIPFILIDHLIERQNLPVLKPATIQARSSVWGKLRTFQKTTLLKGAQTARLYIADDMGTGKTLQALAIAEYFKNEWPCLIVCPSILRFTWKSEISKWLSPHATQPERIVTIKASKELLAPKKPLPLHDFLVISYALIPKVKDYLKNYRVKIFDEAHYIKTLTSKRTQAALTMTQNTPVRLLLSGTPFNYPRKCTLKSKLCLTILCILGFSIKVAPLGRGNFFSRSGIATRKNYVWVAISMIGFLKVTKNPKNSTPFFKAL